MGPRAPEQGYTCRGPHGGELESGEARERHLSLPSKAGFGPVSVPRENGVSGPRVWDRCVGDVMGHL